ncbi:MAG: hypothetical protein OXT03_06685 [Alphaproteobacteria bacterium]|nr:hypothetical protein [Alphaproteobacteria bacterium]
MDNYSFLADLLNKFHTSLPWIQFFWIISVSTFLFSVGWCIKEIFISFAQRAKPKGELICTIYRNDEDKFLVYSHSATQEQVDSDTILSLLTGGKQKLPTWQKPKQIIEKANTDGKKNKSPENDDLDGKG